MKRKIKEASKYTSLERLYEIRNDQYRGVNGQEYYPETIDQLIWQKETNKSENDMIQALKEMDKFELIMVGR